MIDLRGLRVRFATRHAKRVVSESFRAGGVRRGFHRLHFEPALESEFRAYYTEASRPRVRVVFLFGAMILLAFAVHHLHVLEPPLNKSVFFVQAGLLTPTLLLAWLGTYLITRREGMAVMTLGALAAIVIGQLSLYAQAYQQGERLPYEGMLLLLMAGYFAVGLRFPQALGFAPVPDGGVRGQ